MKPELRVKVAHDIMALVDEFPSEPFTYERKVLLEKLEELFAQFVQQADDELGLSFDIGFEEGADSVREEMEAEIETLEDEIADLKDEVEEAKKEAYTDGFAEGYETARAEFDVT
jgi:flagellar biosynthesis/type III secretory pathway protein FliH